MHSFLVAAKSDFLSEHIKSGSFIYVDPLNVKRELNAKEEKDINSLTHCMEKKYSVLLHRNHFVVRFVIKDLHGNPT